MPRFDQDSDIEMVTPPVFEFNKASQLTSWSQQALLVFQRERRQYEDKMCERCLATGEVPERVVASVKSSIETRVLDHLARYVLKIDVFELTDQQVCAAITQKTGALMNNHVPDVDQLVRAKLEMDLREADIEARVLKYYMDFDKIVQDHGVGTIVGPDPVFDEDGRQRVKARCKLLIEHLQPDVLRVDIERLVSLIHRNAKSNNIALYDLVVKRGRQQQHFHLMVGEAKRGGVVGEKPRTTNDKDAKPKGTGQSATPPPAGGKNNKEPPRDGCLHCGGGHWLSDCPTATSDQKEEARDDAVPHRSGTRKCPERQREFLRRYVRELEANGLVERNNASRWAYAAHPVKKPGSDDHRITVDYRPVNEMTVPLAGATPNLAAVTQDVRGAYGFGKFDFFKGFCQLPLHENTREAFSFVTEDGDIHTHARTTRRSRLLVSFSVANAPGL